MTPGNPRLSAHYKTLGDYMSLLCQILLFHVYLCFLLLDILVLGAVTQQTFT